jgi:hypothetical protein
MTENRRPQTFTDGEQKALPKAISDAIDAYGAAVAGACANFDDGTLSICRAALERAIAGHAAATPAPSALERLRERVDRAAAVDNIELGEWRAFDRVLDWIDEEREAKR